MHHYEVTPAGLQEKTNVNDTLIKWQGIEKIWQFRSYIFVQVSFALFHIIPQRDFKDLDEFDWFANQLLVYLEEAKTGT